MKRISMLVALTAAVWLAASVLPAVAQEEERDPRMVDLAKVARENIEAGKSMHTKMSLKVEVPGAQIPDFDVEVWRKGDKVRAEMPTMNQVSIIGKGEVFSYQGQYGVMLHVPPETMQRFADQRDAMLQKLGLPKDQDEAFVAVLEKDMATIVGEKDYDGIPCYVLEVKPEFCQAFTESLGMAGAMGMTSLEASSEPRAGRHGDGEWSHEREVRRRADGSREGHRQHAPAVHGHVLRAAGDDR